jgi:hypothetical protein
MDFLSLRENNSGRWILDFAEMKAQLHAISFLKSTSEKVERYSIYWKRNVSAPADIKHQNSTTNG